MVDKIILHAGSPKAGSSSIQNSFEGLRKDGFFYAPFEHAQHSVFFDAVFGNRSKSKIVHRLRTHANITEDRLRAWEHRVKRQFLQMLKNKTCHTLIFSGEDISGLSGRAKREALNLFRSFGAEVQVILYFRHPEDYAKSAFQQNAKDMPIAEVPEKVDQLIRRRLYVFQELLPPDTVVVRAFDKSKLKNADVVQDLAEIIGIEPPRQRLSNLSMTFPALQLVHVLNTHSNVVEHSHVNRRARYQFVYCVSDYYRSGEKLQTSWFADLAAFSGIDVLSERYGISFERREKNRDQKPLEARLSDFTAFDAEPLRRALVDRGVGFQSDTTIPDLVLALYQSFVAESHASNRGTRVYQFSADQFVPLSIKERLSPWYVFERVEWYLRTRPIWSVLWRLKHWRKVHKEQ